MKSLYQVLQAMPKGTFRPVAFLAVVSLSFLGTNLNAQTAADEINLVNISTEKNGAVVVYSTPLAKGASPNHLVNGQPGSLHFSKKKSGDNLVVVDLGKSYKLNKIKLKYSHSTKLRVYVLKDQPGRGASWASFVVGLQPDAIMSASGVYASLGGAEGEYLVIVPDTDPGAFSDLYVIGFPSTDRRDLIGYLEHDQDDHGALRETPHTADEFREAHVPPQSNP